MPDILPILISAPSPAAADDVRSLVVAAGFTPLDHALGSVPAVDFEPLAAAIVCPSDNLEPAIAQTRRWRVELGDRFVPVIWLAAPAATPLALNAGADLCLPRPPDANTFAAHLHALLRIRESVVRLHAKADQAVFLAERLRSVHDHRNQDRANAVTIHRSLTPDRLPEIGPLRFGLFSLGGDRQFFDAWPAGDDVEFALASSGRFHETADCALGVLVKQLLMAGCVRGPGGRVPVGEILSSLNHAMMSLNLPDRPWVGAIFGRFTRTTGHLELAQAGMASPISVPAAGEIERLTFFRQDLGGYDQQIPAHTAILRPGDKILFSTGTMPRFESVPPFRDLPGREFLAAIGALCESPSPTVDGVLVLLEWVADP